MKKGLQIPNSAPSEGDIVSRLEVPRQLNIQQFNDQQLNKK